MSFKYILFPEKARFCHASDIGGKAFGLAKLSTLGLPVPSWMVVRARAFQQQLEFSGLGSELQRIRDLQGIGEQINETKLAQLQQDFLQADLFPELQEQLQQQMRSVLKKSDNSFHGPWAVRSSVNQEDGQNSSFAGQFSSFLFQRSEADIIRSIKQVWASLLQPHVLAYVKAKGIEFSQLQVAVVVQQMVDADKAGVAFTANPVTGDHQEMLISANFGLGEGVVSGQCDCDEFVLDTQGQVKSSNIANKATCFRSTQKAGIVLQPLESEQQQQSCLNTDELQQLWQLCKRISAGQQVPQDIEWCFGGGKLYVVQARPITAKGLRANSQADEIIWDNSNIQESFCGVTTPLTVDFAQNCYRLVYSQLYRLLGIHPEKHPRLKNALATMLGVINGRVFYNINSWYTALCFLPGFAKNKADMERMMGLEDPIHFELPRYRGWQARKQKLVAARAYSKLIGCFIQFDRYYKRFYRNVNHVYQQVDVDHLQGLSAQQLLSKLEYVKGSLLGHWQAPIINDFLVMMLNGLCLRRLERAGVVDAVHTLNSLLAGQDDIASTEPTKQLIDISKKIATKAGLADLIAVEENGFLLNFIDVYHPDIAADIHAYLKRFGDRVIGELKLETQSLRQTPEDIVIFLRSYLADPERLQKMNISSNEQQLRQQAESSTFTLIKAQQGKRQLRLFKTLLKRLRRAVKDREEMRLDRARAFGLARSLYLALGDEFVSEQALDSRDDIFFLSEAEVTNLVLGLSFSKDAKRWVSMRRQEFEQYQTQEPAHHFYTYGLPSHNNAYQYPFARDSSRDGYQDKNGADQQDDLQGVGCYPGVVNAAVRLITDPKQAGDLNGRILCTMRTDPGWAPLFPACGGIIVERGSTLSHSAIVARELGIPAIVNVPNVTRILSDGETVTMDGASGCITRSQPVDAIEEALS